MPFKKSNGTVSGHKARILAALETLRNFWHITIIGHRAVEFETEEGETLMCFSYLYIMKTRQEMIPEHDCFCAI